MPEPSTADDLHDLLSSLVVVRARDDWQPLWSELAARGRGHTIAGDGAELWCTTEARGDAAGALAGDDAAVAQAVRGHLEIAGITTVDDLAQTTTLRPVWVAQGLAAFEHEGFALQGRYTPDATGTEWVARRLLARMHSYSRRSRRQSVEPATAQDFMRFLLRWQHVAPDTQLAGEAGLVPSSSSSRASRARRSPGSPSCSPAGCAATSPPGSTGCATTARSPGSASRPAAATIPTHRRGTLQGHADRGRVPRRPPVAARRRPSGRRAVEPTAGATAEILEVLRERGACFATDLAAATRRLPEDIERGLWDGVARGLVMSDGFGAIRARVAGRPPSGRPQSGRPGPEPARDTARARSASPGWVVSSGRRPRRPAAGRSCRAWTAQTVSRAEPTSIGSTATSWPKPSPSSCSTAGASCSATSPCATRCACRGATSSGRCAGSRTAGWCGAAASSAASAASSTRCPPAAEQLAHVRKLPTTGERVTVNATDPLNLVGLIVPGDTVAAVRTNRVTYVDGVPDAPSATSATDKLGRETAYRS